MVDAIATLLDSPLAPYLVFAFVLLVVFALVAAIIYVVQKQKIYQLQVATYHNISVIYRAK